MRRPEDLASGVPHPGTNRINADQHLDGSQETFVLWIVKAPVQHEYPAIMRKAFAPYESTDAHGTLERVCMRCACVSDIYKLNGSRE